MKFFLLKKKYDLQRIIFRETKAHNYADVRYAEFKLLILQPSLTKIPFFPTKM